MAKVLARVAGRITEVEVGSGSTGVPLLLARGTTHTVAANTQQSYAVPIRNEGVLVIDGLLVEVR